MMQRPTPMGAAVGAGLAFFAAWWTTAVIVEGPRDPAPPPPSRETCEALERAAALSASTLPARQQAAQDARRERGEIVAVFAPTPCLPGWER